MSQGELVKTPYENREVVFTPLGEEAEISITPGMVKSVLAVKSRSGVEPSTRDVSLYLMLCKSRRLNPFVGDAYLLGYDGHDGTSWSLITSIQALRKRAEANPNFDGCNRGVIVERDGVVQNVEGSFTLQSDTLLGGWATAYRSDQSQPILETVKLATYSTGRSRWKKDPEGMIAKCAEAAALRRAFPSDLAGLYVSDEFDSVRDDQPQQPQKRSRRRSAATDRILPAPDPARSPDSPPTALKPVPMPLESPPTTLEATGIVEPPAPEQPEPELEQPADDGAPSEAELAAAGLTEPETPPEAPEQPQKRKRGRPRKQKPAEAAPAPEAAPEAPMPSEQDELPF